MRIKRLHRAVPIVLGALCLASAAFAAPKADLWPVWDKHNPESTATIDHGLWQSFLATYVEAGHEGVNRVDYGAVTEADAKKLERYLEKLQSTDITSFNRDEQFAYWVNFYNALTVQVILDHWPVDSITDIDISGFLKNGPWDAELAKVKGHELTLNDIEHRILRPIWQDNRIHYAVNCASIGCPNLAPRAFTAENHEEMLEEAAKSFINHPRGAHFEGDQLVVSSIFDWYQVDFGDSEKGVVEHLRKYAEGDLARRLKGYDGDLEDQYNWTINAAP